MKSRIKRRLLSFFNFPARRNNESVRLGWGLVSRQLVSQFPQIVILVLASVVAATLEGATMGLLGLAVSTYVDGEVTLASRLPARLEDFYESVAQRFDKGIFFVLLIVAAVTAQVFKSLALAISDWMQINLTYATRQALQKKLTAHIMGLSYSDVTQIPAGRLATLIDQSKLVLDVTIQFGNLVRASFMAIAYFLVMVSLSVTLTGSVLLAVALLWAVLSVVIGKIRRLAEQATWGELEVWRWTVEYMNAPRLLRVFNSTALAQNNINEAWDRQLRPERRADLIYSLVPKALELITVTGAGAFLVIMFLVTVNEKEAIISTLFVYVLIFFRLRPVFKSFSDFRAKLARIVPRLEVVGNLLLFGKGHEKKAGSGREPVFLHSLELHDVSFSYPGSDVLALKGLNFKINRGETVAIVGRSGAGKSTVADLLLGLFSPTRGEILIDGVDLQETDQARWREKIGVVDQEAFLLNTTIRENIAFARGDVPQADLERVAKAAYADEFIGELEDGYETVIGDRGLRLSGGQQQRVVLARALLRNPEFLILDEATSALDTESERLIQQTLDDLHHNRTILIIAHRLSTIARSDKVIVLDDGAIIEQGKVSELVESGGHFAKLWKLQQGA